jgi:4-amino-4-deoxy-L-arabinose transferase-like glycosyltransferase
MQGVSASRCSRAHTLIELLVAFVRPAANPGFRSAFAESNSRTELLSDPQKSGWRWVEPSLIFLLALVINWTGNGRVSLWDRDEPRYAGCAREMIAEGTWVSPTFNGQPFYHKPILTYWLIRAGFMFAGDTPFGARLGSGLAGAAMCVVVWFWGRRMFGPYAGRWAALVLITAPIVAFESKLATTDAPLVLWVVLAQWTLWELSRRPSWLVSLAFWFCLGLSILTKGPVGPAIIVVAAIASWWWGGSTKYLGRLNWFTGMALCGALTGPWFVAIEIASQGAFHRVLVGEQVLTRASTAFEDHPGFPG